MLSLFAASLSLAPQLVRAQSATQPSGSSVLGNASNAQSARHAHYYLNGFCTRCDKQEPKQLATITLHPTHIEVDHRGKDAIKGRQE